MRLLVPLPFDISNLAHGRNLRIARLLAALQSSCEILCVAVDEPTAFAARQVMPTVRVEAASPAARSSRTTGLVGSASFFVRRSLSFFGCDPNLADAIRRLTVAADVVAGFDMPSVPYLLAAAAVARGPSSRPRIVCDLIDDPWLLRRSAPRKYRWSLPGLKSAAAMQVVRHRVLRRFDALVAVAPDDAAALSRVSTRPTAVVPNGADADPCSAGRWPREALVVFTGSMNFPANESAACFMARRVWPLVLASYRHGLGGVKAERQASSLPRLALVGANPTPAIQRLADLPNVIVTGRVPLIREWLERACVAVAPMLGGTGIKNKILEAAAAGCPVVATSMGVGGLPAGEDAGIIVADGAERIASQVFRLLNDTAAARRIGSAGLDMVRACFSWTKAAEAFLEVLRGDCPPSAKQDETMTTGAAGGEPPVAGNKEALEHATS